MTPTSLDAQGLRALWSALEPRGADTPQKEQTMKITYTSPLGSHGSEHEARKAARAHARDTRGPARVYLTAPGIGAVVVASYDAEGRSLNADDARAIRRSLRARGGR